MWVSICCSANGDITTEHGVYESKPQAMVTNACDPKKCNQGCKRNKGVGYCDVNGVCHCIHPPHGLFYFSLLYELNIFFNLYE